MKRDVLNYCVEALKRSRSTNINEYQKRTEIYEECKAYAKQQGYEIEVFHQIWNRAITERNRLDGWHFNEEK